MYQGVEHLADFAVVTEALAPEARRPAMETVPEAPESDVDTSFPLRSAVLCGPRRMSGGVARISVTLFGPFAESACVEPKTKRPPLALASPPPADDELMGKPSHKPAELVEPSAPKRPTEAA